MQPCLVGGARPEQAQGSRQQQHPCERLPGASLQLYEQDRTLAERQFKFGCGPPQNTAGSGGVSQSCWHGAIWCLHEFGALMDREDCTAAIGVAVDPLDNKPRLRILNINGVQVKCSSVASPRQTPMLHVATRNSPDGQKRPLPPVCARCRSRPCSACAGRLRRLQPPIPSR